MEKAAGAKVSIAPTTRMGQKKIRNDDIKSTTRMGLKRLRKEKVYRESWYKLFVLSFFAVIFGFLALRFILPVPTLSLSESREIKKMPSADVNNIFFGKFTTDFEDYFADTFPLRDPFIEAGDYVSYLFKIPVSGVDSIVMLDGNMMQEEDMEDKVPIGKGGSEEMEDRIVPSSDPAGQAVNPYTGEPTPQPSAQDMQAKGIYLLTDTAIYMEEKINSEQYTAIAEGVNRLAEALPGRRIIVMSPPNSFAFYAAPKYRNPENDQKAGIEDMYGKLAPGIYTVDTYLSLDAHKGEYIYFRTDHHWTSLGAYYGYTAFCEAAGMQPVSLYTMQKNTYERDFLGSGYKQLKNTAKAKLIRQVPDYIDYYIPPAQCQLTMYEKTPMKNGIDIPMFDLDLPGRDWNCYHIFLGGDYPSIKITTDTQNGRSIVLLKDSYANAFTPFLTSNYQYIYLVDFRDYNYRGKPDFSLEQFVKDNDIGDVMLILTFELANDPEFVDWYLKALP